MARVWGPSQFTWIGDELFAGRRRVARIFPDPDYAGMWRVVRPDGTLTDMANRTRAKDAASALAARMLNAEGKVQETRSRGQGARFSAGG